MNPVPRVIDLSHHNTVPKDFKATRKEGIIGVIHKLTEGTDFVDPKVQARFYLAKEAKMLWGLYHFLRPGDMEEQALFFINTARSLEVIDRNTCWIADHEDQSVAGEQLKEFLDHVENMTTCSPVIYSGHVLKEQLEGSGYRPKRRLWLCQYTSSTPSLPEGVDKYWMWQYTDQGKIAGVDPPTDLNDIGNADIAEFIETWSGYHGFTPEPTPPNDKMPRVTMSSSVPIELHVGPNIKVI